MHARTLACLGSLLTACLARPVEAASAPPVACSAEGRRVGYVKVLGRWAGEVALPLVPGELLTSEKLAAAMEALAVAIDANNASVFGLRARGQVGIKQIEVEFDCDPPRRADGGAAAAEVGVVFHPVQVTVALERLGDNVLPVPRSALPTFYANVPQPLLGLNPRIGASYDRAFGVALGGSVDADLSGLAERSRDAAAAAPSNAQALDFHAAGVRAIDGPYYRADGSLRYSLRTAAIPWLRELSLRGDGVTVLEPQGANEHSRQVSALGAGMSLAVAPTTRLVVDAGWQDTRDSLRLRGASSGAVSSQSDAHEVTGRLLLDSLPPPVYGFVRAAAWGNRSVLAEGGGTYARYAGRIGYAKEIAWRPNETVGLEVLAGAGSLTGAAPPYAMYFGGNSPTQFLNGSASSAAMLAMPGGPLLRSMGEGQAGLIAANGSVVGGSRYWHVNLNVALPVERWSRPLIPNELTDIEDSAGRPVTLKQMMRRQVDVSGPALLSETLKSQGMSAEEARREAEAAMAEIRPAVHFIIDDANVFSVRPLLLLDAAGLSGGGPAAARWVALGLGVALTVVTARAEAGYMRTVSGPTTDVGPGAFFFRLVFQNLF